jgi:type II secretory pathway pseudopilin PulG
MKHKNKSQKGLTPLEILATNGSKTKRKHNLSLTGFTLVEIIVAGLIISITTAGTFAAYIYARQFSDKFRHRAMAQRGALGIAEYIRYGLADGYKSTDLESGICVSSAAVDIDDDDYDPNTDGIVPVDDFLGGADGLLDPAIWQINNLVDNLAISYRVDAVYFDNSGAEKTLAERNELILASDPSMPDTRPAFKKITVRVTYNNRTVT